MLVATSSTNINEKRSFFLGAQLLVVTPSYNLRLANSSGLLPSRGSLLRLGMVAAQWFGHQRWLKSEQPFPTLSRPSSISARNRPPTSPRTGVQKACPSLPLTVQTDGWRSPKPEFDFLFIPCITNPSLLFWLLHKEAISQRRHRWGSRKAERVINNSFVSYKSYCTHWMALFHLSARVRDLWNVFIPKFTNPHVINSPIPCVKYEDTPKQN